jgi:hypothetical protein
LAVADFNGDGVLDLAVANGDAADDHNQVLSVLLGKGDGSFAPAVSYAIDTRVQCFAVAVGDFNGDGRADIIVGSSILDSWDPTTGKIDGLLSIFLGNGDGTFRSPTAYKSLLDVPSSIAVGDVNGDGRLDLVVAGHGQSYRPGGTSVLLGNGDGTFETVVSYPGYSVNSVALADLNGDGKLDIVTCYSDDLTGERAVVWLNQTCSAPHLTIGRSGSALTLSWTGGPAGFVLESSPTILPGTWAPLGPILTNSPGHWEVKTNLSRAQDYFRLRRP